MLARTFKWWSVAGVLIVANALLFVYKASEETACCQKWHLRESDKPYVCPPSQSRSAHSIGNMPLVKWTQDWDGLDWTSGKRTVPTGADRHFPWRRIILVRHGQYFGHGDQAGHLSPIGFEQARLVGERLKSTNISFSTFTSSSAPRARETAEVIASILTKPDLVYSDLLVEGWPVFPEPAIPQWDPNDPRFVEEGKRLDQAYRTFIHRANIQQTTHSTDLIVAHGNIIGNFVLRALQVSPERWLKLSVYQASITVMDIGADGDTYVRVVGDVGHMPLHLWTG